MAPRVSQGRAYKDITFPQLRSFYETARLGSLSAAAASLGISQPTVSQQVHALERQFGDKLIEPFGRGSRLTEAGKLLADLITPAVLSVSQLKQQYRQACGALKPRLAIAAPPRVMVEDLPECVRAFTRRHPDVQLVLRECWREQIPAFVESGEVDLGFTGTHSTEDDKFWASSPWLQREPWYEVDTILITPKNHPLARRRTVRPRDLMGYTLVNGLDGIADQYARSILDKLGLLQNQANGVQANLAATIYRFVEMGFGIGLAGARPGNKVTAKVHVRDMSRHLGRQTVSLVRRRHASLSESALAFAETVKQHFRS
jgi:DNA-binding transcriptional LysR family regulator